MSTKPSRLLLAVLSLCLILHALILNVSPVQAAGMQVSEAIAQSAPNEKTAEKTATLVGPRADAPIPLYLRPAANQPNVGYGISGSSVTVLEQIASFLPEADQSAAWNHVRLDDAPYTEGWVQGRFLSISESPTPSAE